MSAATKPPSGFEEPIPGYRLTDLLGRGGFGEVWRAAAPGGISKAIKLIFGDDPAKCANELKALNRVKDVRHPFLLSIERIEQHDDTLIIVTELGDRNLQEHYRAYRDRGLPGIPQAELLGMLRDVADVLDFIYEEYALQHLDVKPANLLLFGKRLKVGDFGLVKNIYERSQSLVAGLTPTYAAPEVFDGQPTRASDQYSLAILYYEMLTGTLPFDGGNAARLAAQHLREAPNLKHLPTEQQAVIARALSKDPQQRFPGCKALIEALDNAIQRTAAGEAAARANLPFANPSMLSPRPRKPTPATVAVSENKASLPAQSNRTTVNVSAMDANRPMPPTIVVGVGGAAAHLVQRFQQRVVDRLGGAAATPALQLLVIDTDPQTLNEIDRHGCGGESIKLNTVTTPLRSSAEYRQQGQQHRRWLSRRWLYNIPRNLRTDGLRPLGRLALLSNSTRVLAAVRAAVGQAIAAGQTSGNPSVPPRVLLVGSIAGGTGGGMLLDLAYVLRAELQTKGIHSAELDGLLLHATPSDAGRDKANLNAMVTLRELLHYSADGRFYPGEPLLETPPFHGNNRTFHHVDLLPLGHELDTAAWLRQIDHAAEFVYARLATTLDAHRQAGTADNASAVTSVNVLQIRQIGGDSGGFLEPLTRDLCRAVTEAWLGRTSSVLSATRTTSGSATLVLNSSKNERHERLQQLTGEAEACVRNSGATNGPLLKRAHDMLAQELGRDERAWLQLRIDEAFTNAAVARQSDHDAAQSAVLALDQRVGLDFEAEPERCRGQTLFDLLRARLASQAMQVASRITGWIADLVDHPEGGVEAALHAAEACRQVLRDLNQVAGQELQAARNRQTAIRIGLTAAMSPAEAPRSGRNWLGGRSRTRIALEEKLLQLGLLIFEELGIVCVDGQLRAIESHVSDTIDQLLNLGQEVRTLQARWTDDNAGDANYDAEPIQRLLFENRHRLVAELRLRIERDVLTGPKKLQRFLPQKGVLANDLEEPLRRHARQVVLHCMRRLISLLLQPGAGGQAEVNVDLDACLQAILDEPWSLPVSGSEQTYLIAPRDAAGCQLENRLTTGSGPVIPIYASTNSLAVCREARNIPLETVMQHLVGPQSALWALAENMHTRIDVEWSQPDAAPKPDLDALLSLPDAPSEETPFEATMRLTRAD